MVTSKKDINGLIHSPYRADPRSHISTISYVLKRFLDASRRYTQKIDWHIIYVNPTADAYIPACMMECGTDINATPTYNFIKLAMVGIVPEVLIALVSFVKCLSENLESVYGFQLALTGMFSFSPGIRGY